MRIALTIIAIVIYTFAIIGVYEVFKQENSSDVNGDGVVNMQDLSIVAANQDE